MHRIPRIAAAVCNFNRKDLVIECVDSVLAQGLPVDVCVVDNASTDGSVASLEARYDRSIQLHSNAENLGSSGGFHRAIEMAMATGAPYIAVLDSDCVLGAHALHRMADYLEGDPSCGLVGPKVYWAGRPRVVQEIGAFLNWESAEFVRNEGDRDEGTAGEPSPAPRQVDYVPACCLLVRRRVVEEHGNVDPGFFLYFDDIEWCTRIKRGGEHIVALPTANATHHGGGVNKTNHFVTYYYWRNRAHFFRRNTPREKAVAARRRLHEDAVRAMATCRALELHQAGSIIERASRDALAGVWGAASFRPGELAFDAPSSLLASPTDGHRIERVPHVLEDVTRANAEDPGLILEDDFGRRILAAGAWALKPKFLRQREDLDRAFSELLKDPS